MTDLEKARDLAAVIHGIAERYDAPQFQATALRVIEYLDTAKSAAADYKLGMDAEKLVAKYSRGWSTLREMIALTGTPIKRRGCPIGFRRPGGKTGEIMRRLAAGEATKAIASALGVTPQAVSLIKNKGK